MNDKKNNPEAASEFLSEEELDRELARMAEETPEMPDDFHSRWTEQIRAEAGKTAGKAPAARRQWRYILSAAAVFVFLIGGTLLTRNQGKVATQNKPERTESAAAGSGEADAGTVYNSMVYSMEPEAGTNALAVETAEPAEAAVYMDDMEEAAETEASAGMAEPAAIGKTAVTVETAVGEDSAADSFAGAAEKTAAKSAGGEPAPAQTMMPSPVPEQAPEEDAEPGTAESQGEADGGFAGFLKDLGIFTLKALAVAAGAAALALLAAAISRGIRKKKS